MSQLRYRLLCGACGLLVFALGLNAQSFEVVDGAGHSTVVTAAQLVKMARVKVEVRDYDSPARFEGVTLASVLSSAGIELGDKLRGPRLTEALLVEASDGYKVVFVLAELDPAFASRETTLADMRDGKPLDAKQGPFRIVAPGDKRPARWIRQVTSLKIVVVK
jgi:hypothetical protein